MEKNTYKLLNIILLESEFKRLEQIQFSQEFKSDLQIGVQNNIKENKITVTLEVKFNAKHEEIEYIFARIKMTGIFEFPTGNKNIVPSPNEFAQINGPAIIFPFIREHLATVTLKAGIPPILLPPINFVKLSRAHKDKTD